MKTTKEETLASHQEEVDRYTREELLENAEALFHVKQEVLFGAWYGDDRPVFSIDELKTLINDFLKRSVN